jgi:predicted ATPase
MEKHVLSARSARSSRCCSPTSWGSRLRRPTRRDLHRLAALLEALAEEQPLVLVFDDLHWADDALLDFVDHLVDWASGVPILVLATARPDLLGRRPDWGGGRANATAIRLSPLSLEETTRLFGALFAEMAARPWFAHTQYDYARALLRRGSPATTGRQRSS